MVDLAHIRHSYATSTPGDYVQNAAEFDAVIAKHDRELYKSTEVPIWTPGSPHASVCEIFHGSPSEGWECDCGVATRSDARDE